MKRPVIEPLESPWAAPIILVRKRDRTLCCCIEHRCLFEVTKKDSYPLPNMQDCQGSLDEPRFFSSMDRLCSSHPCMLSKLFQVLQESLVIAGLGRERPNCHYFHGHHPRVAGQHDGPRPPYPPSWTAIGAGGLFLFILTCPCLSWGLVGSPVASALPATPLRTSTMAMQTTLHLNEDDTVFVLLCG